MTPSTSAVPLRIRLPLPRWLALGGVGLAGALFILGVALVLYMGQRGDFLAFYSAGVALLRGVGLYDFKQFQAWQLAWVGPFDGAYFYVYLPAFAALFLPLAALPLAVARALWLALMAACLLAATRIAGRWMPLPLPGRLVALLAFVGSYAAFVVGQNSALTLALWATIAATLWRGPPTGRTGLTAALLLYKPQLLLPLGLLWLWRGWWRGLVGLAVGTVGVVAASLLIVPGALQHYLGLQQWALTSTTTHRANAAFFAELSQRVGPAAGPLATALGAAVLVLLLIVWGRRGTPTPAHHAMLWLAPLLVTPYVANYDLMLLLLPLSLLSTQLAGRRWLQLLVGLLWLAPLFNLLAGEVMLPTTWLSLLLFLACAWLAVEARRAPATAHP